MKRLLIAILTSIAFITSGMDHDNPDESIPIPFIAQGEGGSTPMFRSPIVPVQGYYDPLLSTIYVVFNYNIGNVCYHVENVDTGEYQNGTLSSYLGIDNILISGNKGTYVISIFIGTESYYGIVNI